jgi:hypothetical protein
MARSARDFLRSHGIGQRPIVVTACMFGSSKSRGLNSTHIHGTSVPVEEPSTAS